MNVFLSHSRADSPLATRVSESLQKKAFQVGSPDLDLFSGDNWGAKLARALEDSQAMVVLLTPNAVNSSHVKRKIEYAIGEKRFRNRFVRVVVVDHASLVLTIFRESFADYAGSNWMTQSTASTPK